MSWIQLQPLEAQSLYGIPSELATNPKNLFWGVPFTLPYEYDSPRPFLAFLPNDKNSNIFTFHLQTIEPETWEFKGMLPNPLIMEGGILGLHKPLLKGLVEVLLSYQARIPVQINRPPRMFDIIKSSQLKQFRINPELFPNTRQEHFIQSYDPSSNEGQSITILILSNSPGSGKINLQIRRFSSESLKDVNFNPLNNGISKINLDRNGLHEFIRILENQNRYI